MLIIIIFITYLILISIKLIEKLLSYILFSQIPVLNEKIFYIFCHFTQFLFYL
jgi:hypothetical protein